VLTVLLVAFFYYSWGSPLGNLQRPEESLERLVSREMDLDQAFQHLPPWERRLYEMTGSDPETFDDAIARLSRAMHATCRAPIRSAARWACVETAHQSRAVRDLR